MAWNVYREGPEHAFGGLIPLLEQPQYGEADAPSRSGAIADELLERAAARPEPEEE